MIPIKSHKFQDYFVTHQINVKNIVWMYKSHVNKFLIPRIERMKAYFLCRYSYGDVSNEWQSGYMNSAILYCKWHSLGTHIVPVFVVSDWVMVDKDCHSMLFSDRALVHI